MKLLYKPFGILAGLVAGLVAKRLFDFAWTKVDEEEPPKPTTLEATWAKVLGAAALQGIIFKTVRVVVDRFAAQRFAALTGVWPGESAPDRDDG